MVAKGRDSGRQFQHLDRGRVARVDLHDPRPAVVQDEVDAEQTEQPAPFAEDRPDRSNSSRSCRPTSIGPMLPAVAKRRRVQPLDADELLGNAEQSQSSREHARRPRTSACRQRTPGSSPISIAGRARVGERDPLPRRTLQRFAEPAAVAGELRCSRLTREGGQARVAQQRLDDGTGRGRHVRHRGPVSPERPDRGHLADQIAGGSPGRRCRSTAPAGASRRTFAGRRVSLDRAADGTRGPSPEVGIGEQVGAPRLEAGAVAEAAAARAERRRSEVRHSMAGQHTPSPPAADCEDDSS